MANVRKNFFNEKLKDKAWLLFREEVAASKDAASCFKKYFTPREIDRIEKRLAILALLQQGRSYLSIRRELDVSPGTISFVKHGFKIDRRLQRETSCLEKSRRRRKLPRYKGSRGLELAER